MRDLVNHIGAVPLLAPAVKASASETGTAVDLAGFGSAAILIQTGAIDGDGAFSIKLQESDTTTAGDFEDVAATDLTGTLPETLEANSIYRQGYVGNRRYLRAVLTRAGGTSIVLAALLVKGNPRHFPVA